jgi:hypothetical protein
MSFCTVPRSAAGSTPCFSATSSYRRSKTDAGALIVIDVDTSPSGMPSSRISMSASESIATPVRPTSPSERGSSES